MRLAEIGFRIRQARLARGLTQEQLATNVGLARPTLNQVENGLARELGVTKVLKLFDAVGLEIIITNAPPRRSADPLRIAATAASVGFKAALSEDDLLRALLTGALPERKGPQIRRLLEDSPPELVRGLVEQVGGWTKAGRIEKNLSSLAKSLDIESDERWIPHA